MRWGFSAFEVMFAGRSLARCSAWSHLVSIVGGPAGLTIPRVVCFLAVVDAVWNSPVLPAHMTGTLIVYWA